MNVELENNDHEVLASFSEKLISGNLDENEQDILLTILGKYEKEDLQKHLKKFLNKHEIQVITNFHDNIKSFTNLIVGHELSQEKNNQILRQYFFTGKKVNDGFFSQTYRHVLNYIQTSATLKVKTEVYFDIHSYFKYGCLQEDLENDSLLKTYYKEATEYKDENGKKINLLNQLEYADDFDKRYALKQLSERIKELSDSRNIGVKVIANKNNDYLSISINDDYLSKSNIAKSGYIDRVKNTPQGIVISLGTADATLQFDSEKEQLAKHIAALETAIIRKEFLGKNIKDIKAIDFYSLTQFTNKNGQDIQNDLTSLGFEHEAMSFISKSFGFVLGSTKISNELKEKISFNGILCSDLTSENLFDTEVTLNKFLDKVLTNKNQIIDYVKVKGGLDYISDYFNNLSKFISTDSNKFEIKNHQVLIDKMDQLEDLAHKLKLSPVEIESAKINLMPDFQKLKYERFSIGIKNQYLQHIDNQILMKSDLQRQKDEIKEIVKHNFKIDVVEIEEKAMFNLWTVKSSTVSKAERNELGNKLKGYAFNNNPSATINFTPAQRLYVHLNPEFEKKLINHYGYDSKKWKNAANREKMPEELKILIGVVDGLDNKDSNSMFTLEKIWVEEDFFKQEKKKTKTLKR